MHKFLLLTAIFIISMLSAKAQITFQYHDSATYNGTTFHFLLHIPDSLDHVKGVVIANDIYQEQQFIADTNIKNALKEAKLGLVFIQPAMVAVFDGSSSDTMKLLSALQGLAIASSYPEIANCPWLPYGHSTAGIFVRNLCFWKPERVMAAVLYNSGSLQRPSWSNKSIKDIPFIGFSGQFEEVLPYFSRQYFVLRDSMMKFRGAEQALMSACVRPGGNHYNSSDANHKLVSQFFISATKYRVPNSPTAFTAPITLNAIDYHSGYLTDTAFTTIDASTTKPMAKFDAFTGDTAVSYWHLDSAMAASWVDYHTGKFGKLDDAITIAGGNFDNGGRTQMPNYTLGSTTGNIITLNASSQSNTNPVRFEVIRGPGHINAQGQIVVDAAKLATQGTKLEVSAIKDADATYRHIEKVASIGISVNNNGTQQSITLTPIPDKNYSDPDFNVSATSDNADVNLFVYHGAITLAGTTAKIGYLRKGVSTVSIYATDPGSNTNGKQSSITQRADFKIAGDTLGLTLSIKPNMLKVFPNPATSKFSVTHNTGASITNVEVFNIAGTKAKDVSVNRITEQQFTVNIENLSKGIYTVMVTTPLGRYSARLVK